MRQHLENLRQKPEHVRHKIALGTSAGATALIAIVWFAASAATGSFALAGPQAVPADKEAVENIAEAKSGLSQIAGAVGSVLGATSSDPALTVVDGATYSTLDSAPAGNQNPSGATAIPF